MSPAVSPISVAPKPMPRLKLRAVDHPGELVASELVGAEQVLGAGRLEGRERVGEQRVDLVNSRGAIAIATSSSSTEPAM